jgi:hypothetical protein
MIGQGLYLEERVPMPEKPMNQRLREESLRVCMERDAPEAPPVGAGEVPAPSPSDLEGEAASKFLISPELIAGAVVEWPDVDLGPYPDPDLY